MDSQAPAVCSLPPELAHHVLRHLSKRDKQQFALCCKHTYLCALAAVKSLVLRFKCLSSSKPLKFKTMKYCSSVTLRPRTMEELTELAALLLVHNIHRFPALTCLRLELLNVYDKQCDISLIIKSVVLHAKQLTQLHVEQEAQASHKTMAAIAELPMLERLTVKSRNGFEPGALGQLSRAVNVNTLHLEILPDSSGNNPFPLSPSAAAAAAACSSNKSPSELARLQAADEVGLAKMAGQLQSFTAIGFSTAGSVRPITALLAAVAGSPKPRLSELQLGAQEVPCQTLNLIASIASLSTLKLLPGCELASALELSRLSALGGLTQLQVAPVMPPAPVLAAWAKGCRNLNSLGVCGQPGPLPLTPTMPGITQLQLLSADSSRSRHGSATGSAPSSSPGGLSVDLGSLAITLRSPLSLSGVEMLWPKLCCLEIVGWALDATSIAAIRQLESLSSIKFQGGRDPGTALHAPVVLPLLDKPGLRKLALLEVTDLNDTWVNDALQQIAAASADGSAPAVRELHLGSAPAAGPGNPASSSGNASMAGISSSGGMCAGESGFGCAGSQMLTDQGLFKLAGWPGLSSLLLSNLPGITLAGVKGLVAACGCLGEVWVQGCPAVTAAPADSISKAAVGPAGKAVNLWVS